MNFINILFQNSTTKEAKLYPAAKRASENPAIGITIQNQAAYHVIKDCANITQLYLPHFVFNSFQDPFKTLRQKFKREDIKEFIHNCKTNSVLNQLLEIILYRAQQQISGSVLSSTSPKQLDVSVDDPYGDYALYVEDTNRNNKTTNSLDSFDILCQVFDANQ